MRHDLKRMAPAKGKKSGHFQTKEKEKSKKSLKKRKISVFISVFVLLVLSAILFSSCQSGKSWKFERSISLEDIKPLGIAVENDGLWLSDVAGNRVVKIDLTGRILQQFAGFQRPMHIFFYDSTVYIPEYLTDSIKMIRENKIRSVGMTEKPDAPAGIAVNGDRLAVVDFYNH